MEASWTGLIEPVASRSARPRARHGGARSSRALAQAVAARRHTPRPARRGWVRVGPASRWGPRALDRPRPRACTQHGGGPAHRRRLGFALAARSRSGRGLGRSTTAARLERFGIASHRGIARTTRGGSHTSGSGGRRGGSGRGRRGGFGSGAPSRYGSGAPRRYGTSGARIRKETTMTGKGERQSKQTTGTVGERPSTYSCFAASASSDSDSSDSAAAAFAPESVSKGKQCGRERK